MNNWVLWWLVLISVVFTFVTEDYDKKLKSLFIQQSLNQVEIKELQSKQKGTLNVRQIHVTGHTYSVLNLPNSCQEFCANPDNHCYCEVK